MRQAPRIMSVGVVLASLAAFGWVASGALDAADTLAQVQWKPFVAAVVLQLAALMYLMFLWERLLVKLSGNRPRADKEEKHSLFTAYSRSWLARYIPGRIWAMGGRMLLASRVGVPAQEVARSMAYEVLFSYSIVTIAGAALLVGARVHLLLGVGVFLVGMGAFSISVPIMQRLLGRSTPQSEPASWFSKLRSRTQKFIVGATYFSGWNTVWAVTVYGVYAGFQLLFIVLIAESFVDLTFFQMAVIAGAWGLSITLGWVSFLAPVGLGVRDGLAFVMFAQVLDVPTASLIVAAARVVLVAADLVFVGLVEVLALAMSSRRVQAQAPTQTGNRHLSVP